MIGTCRNCKRNYWCYNPEHPPRRFCSWPCKDFWIAERRAHGDTSPAIPAAILAIMYSHRLIVHQTKSSLAWFDCDECERLQEQYAESLAWHQEENTRVLDASPESHGEVA